MAYAMIGGILAATGLTLVFLPALYVAWFRVPEPEHGSMKSKVFAEERTLLGADSTSVG
jgi:hypothetical protein